MDSLVTVNQIWSNHISPDGADHLSLSVLILTLIVAYLSVICDREVYLILKADFQDFKNSTKLFILKSTLWSLVVKIFVTL